MHGFLGAGFAVDTMSARFSSPTALTVTSPTSAGLNTPSASQNTINEASAGGKKSSGALSTGAIIGIAVGGAVLFILAGGHLCASCLSGDEWMAWCMVQFAVHLTRHCSWFCIALLSPLSRPCFRMCNQDRHCLSVLSVVIVIVA